MQFKVGRDRFILKSYRKRVHQEGYWAIDFTATHIYTGLETTGQLVVQTIRPSSFDTASRTVTNKYTILFINHLDKALEGGVDFTLSELVQFYYNQIAKQSAMYSTHPIPIELHIDVNKKHIKDALKRGIRPKGGTL